MAAVTHQVLLARSAVSTEVEQFLTRTTGLDAAHTNAYTALIDGLVADGIWSKLDLLHVYATQNSTTALLNLVSTSYNGTANGSPAFTADRGYTGGANNNSTVYIDTGFNPVTAGSPKYVTNSAHLSAWSVIAVGVTNEAIIGATQSAHDANIMPRENSSGNALFRVNSSSTSGLGAATADQIGFYLGNRSSSSAVQGYKNNTQLVNNTGNTSATLNSLNFTTLSGNTVSFGHHGSPYQCAMASIGSSLNGTEALAFYNRLRTYMTAMGVP